MNAIFIDKSGYKPLKITRSNKVATKYGEFDRKSLEILDFITARMSTMKNIKAGDLVTVSLSEIALLLFGGEDNETPSSTQLTRAKKYVYRMYKTPLIMQNKKHYLFNEFSCEKSRTSHDKQVKLMVSNDSTIIRYLCKETKDYYTCDLNILEQIDTAADYKLFSWGIGALKNHTMMTIDADLSDLNNIFKGDKNFSRPSTAIKVVRDSVRSLNRNPAINILYHFEAETFYDRSDNNSFEYVRLTITNLSQNNAPNKEKSKARGSEIDLLMQNSNFISDFNKLKKKFEKESDIDYENFKLF